MEEFTISKSEVVSSIARFEQLLESAESEEAIHSFLSHHTYFFNGLLRLYGASPLYSKVRLGSDHEVDFAFFDTNSYGPEWVLIEIEHPKRTLFNKNGDNSAILSHALRQVEDWHGWVHRHLDYAKKLMPHIEYPMCHIFLGRRESLTDEHRKRLRRLNFERRASVQVHTYDSLLGYARSTLGLFDASDSTAWFVPPMAYSHSELNKGLPAEAMHFMNDWNSPVKRETFKRDLLQERMTSKGTDA